MLFTPEQLERVRRIILDHHCAMIISVFGADALPETVKEQLRAAGVPIPTGPMLLEDAYAYGQLLASLLQPSIAEEGPDEIRARIEAHPIPTTPIEDAAQSAAANHAAQYVTGLAHRVAQDVVAGFAQEEDALTPDTIRRVIADTTEAGIARREATGRITSNLGHSIQNWTRDWLRIATTETNDAIQSGTASVIEGEHGTRARVSRVPRPDACADCKAFFLDGDGNPKIFFLDELRANGSNVGRPRSQWKATLGCMHPWCGCMTVHVAWGLTWKDGELVPLVTPSFHEEVPAAEEGEHQRNAAIVEGVHAKITQKSDGPVYIGPKGGRWANPQHTEHWEPGKPRQGHQLALPLFDDEDRQNLEEDAAENGVDLKHYFASGSNHSGEIEGFAQLGWNVGVAAPKVNHQAELALYALKGKGTKVFVDSGAFSEIGFNPAPYVKAPITDEEWDKRLDLYDRLASHLGSQLYAVAPDKVAFQADTYERLKRYAPRIQSLAARGANILVPLQKGELSIADFDRKVENLLGIDFIRAIPMKKDATSTADFEGFLRERQPRRIHLLGLGENNERLPEVMAAVKRLSPRTEVFLDSVKITSAVERPKLKPNGTWSRPRKLTAAQDRVRLRARARAFDSDDYAESIGEPSSWLSGAARDSIAKERGLSPADTKRFKKDPTAFIHSKDADGDVWTHDFILMEGLDRAWAAYYEEKGTTVERKRESIKEVFGGKRLLHLKTRAEAIADAVADEHRPEHRPDAELYRWETKIEGEGAHREAIEHAVRTHEMTPKEYTALHEKDYGPLRDFLKDPGRGDWIAGQAPLKKSVDLDAFVGQAMSRVPKAPQIFIGPKGGRWRDAQHTEHAGAVPDPNGMHTHDMETGNAQIVTVDVPALALDEYDARVQLFGAAHRNPQAAEAIREARAKAEGGPLHLTRAAAYFMSTELRDSLKVLSDPHLALEPHSQYLALALHNAITALHGSLNKGEAPSFPVETWEDPAHRSWIEGLLRGGCGPAEVLAKAEGIFDSPRLPRRMLLLGNWGPRPSPGEAARNAGLAVALGTDPETRRKKAKAKKKKKRRKPRSASDDPKILTAKHSLTPRAEGEEPRTARDYAPQTLIQNREAYNDPASIAANMDRLKQAMEDRRRGRRGILEAVRMLPRNPEP